MTRHSATSILFSFANHNYMYLHLLGKTTRERFEGLAHIGITGSNLQLKQKYVNEFPYLRGAFDRESLTVIQSSLLRSLITSV